MLLRPLFLLLATLLLASCGGSETNGEAESSPPVATRAGSAPDISGAGLDGEALGVEDFAGKPVFVNVWSSW